MAYILQLLPIGDCCASSSSTNGESIKIFDLERTDKPTIELEHHQQGRVNQLVCSHSSGSSLLFGCFSSSSVILAWDTRSNQLGPTLQINGQSATPFLSLAHATGDTPLIAAGSSSEDESASSQIELFDLRSSSPSTPLCIYDQAHSDSITCLEFNPAEHSAHQLLSASTDGLLVLHDTNIADQDHSILFTANTGASLAHARWQPDSHSIWAASDMETLSQWHPEQLSLVKDYGDLRQGPLAKPDPSWQEPVSYIISLANPSPTQSAYFAGSQCGDVILVDTTQPDTEKWNVLASLKSGHTEMVRCAALDHHNARVLTGGEDGQICVWSTDREKLENKLLNQFTPSSTPTQPSQKTASNLKITASKQNRFNPYNRI